MPSAAWQASESASCSLSEVVWEAAGSCLRHRRNRLSSRLYCLTQAVARRAALGLMAGAAALIANTPPSEAAFGEAARVFGGKPTNTSGELLLLLWLACKRTCSSAKGDQ